MNKPRSIPWLRIGAESVAIIASILLAFAIDAWWDNRKAVAEDLQYLSSLEADLQDNVRLAGETSERISQDSAVVQSFLAMTPEMVDSIPENLAGPTVEALWRTRNTSLNSTAVIATIEVDPSVLRSDPELRGRLAGWRASIDSLDRLTVSGDTISQEVMAAAAINPNVWPALISLRGELALAPSVAREVREDDDVMRLAAQKEQLNQRQIFVLEFVRTNAERALEVIRRNSR
jgi:hypothetical protein